jgi:hypothetical protein
MAGAIHRARMMLPEIPAVLRLRFPPSCRYNITLLDLGTRYTSVHVEVHQLEKHPANAFLAVSGASNHRPKCYNRDSFCL